MSHHPTASLAETLARMGLDCLRFDLMEQVGMTLTEDQREYCRRVKALFAALHDEGDDNYEDD